MKGDLMAAWVIDFSSELPYISSKSAVQGCECQKLYLDSPRPIYSKMMSDV